MITLAAFSFFLSSVTLVGALTEPRNSVLIKIKNKENLLDDHAWIYDETITFLL